MKCVVFGGGGFIGSAIVERLLTGGHQLRIFDRIRAENALGYPAMADVEWMTGDLLDADEVDRAIIGADVVVHAISSTLPKNSNDDPIFDVQSNIIGSLHILNAMVKRNVKRILFISSGGTVYGRAVYEPIDEGHPTNPLVSYGVTKLAIEKYLGLYEHLYGITGISLRVSNPFGARQRIEQGQGVIGIFLHKALTGKTIEIWGDGSVVRDFIHVSDVAEAFARAIDYEGQHRVFNISSSKGTSLNDLIQIVEATLGHSLKCRRLASRSFDAPVSVLSNLLARNEFDWAPKVSLRDGVARTAGWMAGQLAP